MNASFDLPEADWATVGVVGEPGRRTFFLQARQGDELVTLKLEKQQVAAVAQFLAEILSDLPSAEGGDPVDLDLVEPVEAAWAVGELQLAYDSEADRILLVARQFDPQGSLPGDEPDPADRAGSEDDLGSARIGMTRQQAAAIARLGADLVTAGRPLCGLCGRPMDPEGHSCPRTNGHKPS